MAAPVADPMTLIVRQDSVMFQRVQLKILKLQRDRWPDGDDISVRHYLGEGPPRFSALTLVVDSVISPITDEISGSTASLFNPSPSVEWRDVPVCKAARHASLIGFFISDIAAFISGEYTILPSFA